MLLGGQDTRLLNFIVIGDIRSGTGVVQSSLCNHPGVICHGEIMHHDEQVRKLAHENYFGLSKSSERIPEWFVEDLISPWQYINHTILDNPQHGESAVGFRLLYQEVHKWELYDLFETRCREGDFCIIHITRNPIACFVSLKQAQRSNLWRSHRGNITKLRCPGPIYLNTKELIDFCRMHIAIQGKIRISCTDILEVPYRELFVNYQYIMHKVFEFLELPDNDELAVSSWQRLRNNPILDRIANLSKLKSEVPSDIRQLFEAEDLF